MTRLVKGAIVLIPRLCSNDASFAPVMAFFQRFGSALNEHTLSCRRDRRRFRTRPGQGVRFVVVEAFDAGAVQHALAPRGPGIVESVATWPGIVRVEK